MKAYKSLTDAQIRQLMASAVIDYLLPYHHSGMANFLFFDGHVEAMNAVEHKYWRYNN